MSSLKTTKIAATTDGLSRSEVGFTIIIDTREQSPYQFLNLFDNADRGSVRLVVPTMRSGLKTGDYSIFGFADVVAIERKSKQDLYGSISQNRENFEERLCRMQEFDFSAVVVEAGWHELLSSPPRFTKFQPKALSRTIQSWMVRYPMVHWVMAPDRDYGEAFTFRLLQRFWIERQGEPCRQS